MKPRDLYHALLEPQIHADQVEDICVIQARADGKIQGEPMSVTLELVERHDPETGFTAMERVTGAHAALMAVFIAQSAIPPGVRTLDRTVPALDFVAMAQDRGFSITENGGDAGNRSDLRSNSCSLPQARWRA